MKRNVMETQSVLCVKNDGYPASLELRKIYQVVPDDSAAKHQLIRAVDESGEACLYPEDCFVAIQVPQLALRTLAFAR